jgi:hypothetical protein
MAGATATGRGAQVVLGDGAGAGRDVARGAFSSSFDANQAESRRLHYNGIVANGAQSDGTTRSGAPAVDLLVSSRLADAGQNFANDAAAASGGVAIGQLYRNGSILMVRVA